MAVDSRSVAITRVRAVNTWGVESVSATFDKSFVLPWICPVAKTLIGDLGTLVDGEEDSWVKSKPLAL